MARNRIKELTALPGFWHESVCVVVALCLVGTARVEAAQSANAHGMVATVHPLATDAAVQAMKDGGNAIDAAVAVALTLGVVDGHNSGLGGGCFMVVRLANGT